MLVLTDLVAPISSNFTSHAPYSLRSRYARCVRCSLPDEYHVQFSFCSGTADTEGIATSLKGVEVFDLSGKAIPIVDLWRDRKAVVAFARHFG
jgi:hypothetical protein